MKFTVKTMTGLPVCVSAVAGQVLINGLALLPHEAAMVGDALSQCADQSESLAAATAAKLQPVRVAA
jgi:hypothetical protein